MLCDLTFPPIIALHIQIFEMERTSVPPVQKLKCTKKKGSESNGTNLKLLATAFTPVFQLNHRCPWCRINVDRA